MTEKLKIAKNIILEELEKAGYKILKIILFGSRAKGDFNSDSDWDFLIILDKNISFREIKKITGIIQLRLAEHEIPNDIILRGMAQFEESKKVIGNISYYANKEGIAI